MTRRLVHSKKYGDERTWQQIIYHNFDNNRFEVVDIKTEPSFSFGKPTVLPIENTQHYAPSERNYDITPDGRQLVVILPASAPMDSVTTPPTPQINVVLNWFEELKQRVPVH